MRIGPLTLENNLIVAPMAGVTDRPFRQLCRAFGAGLAVSEMVTGDTRLWGSAKTRRRLDHKGETTPISVQIVGADPVMLADAARHNVDMGAQIIDINMGCPAKKVCNVLAGSALMKDESLVGRILEAVVKAVDVPVTLKIRTGWDRDCRNALAVLRLAEASGIAALAVHGRTRACGFTGSAEYETIAGLKAAARIPVIANGDITTPEKARYVLEQTGADAIMIGRGAQGRPWIFREIAHYLSTGSLLPPPTVGEVRQVLVHHLHELYTLYGEEAGTRIARKHVAWYVSDMEGGLACRRAVNASGRIDEQLAAVDAFFAGLGGQGDRLPLGAEATRMAA